MLRLFPKPWRVFGWSGLLIIIAWLSFGGLTLRSDAKLLLAGRTSSSHRLIGRDFVNVWYGGHLVSTGKAKQVYDRDAYRSGLRQTKGLRGIYAYSYPPHMLLASLPFGLLGYELALIVWLLFTFGLFWWAARPWLVEVGLPSWSTLILPASLMNFWAGHFGFLIGGLVLLGLRHSNDKPISSGLAFACMTVKPHLGILIPLILLAKRCWSTIGSTVAFTFLFAFISAIFLGSDLWKIWLESTLSYQASLIASPSPGMSYLHMMPTVERFAASLGFKGSAKFIIEIGFAAAAFFLLHRAWKQGLETRLLGLLSIIAIYLILPYVFHYDMVAYDLAILVLTAKLAQKLNTLERFVSAMAFLIPIAQSTLAKQPPNGLGIQIAPVLILLTLFIFVRRLADQK